ncbi:MAG: hypothetical protein ACE5GA_02370, partial [Candidatus Zixiibacteriota bacterium]
DSGIPYMIMRPSWFFESLPMFIRSGRARFLGKQPIKRRWLSAADYGRQVSRAFQRDDTVNKHYYNYGPEPLAIPEALARYCRIKHPGITPSSTPYTMAKVLSYAPGFNSLRLAIPFFKFFESSPEDGDAGETNSLLGANTQTLEEWAKAQP